MRYKNFQGKTLDAARAEARRSLGQDALIAATHDLGKEGYRIVCALEPEQRLSSSEKALPPRQVAEVARALSWHHFPFEMIEELLDVMCEQRSRGGPEASLAAALQETSSFETLPEIWANTRAILFFGPPGCGKTATCVKMAWQARLRGLSPCLVSADTLRTGGAEQLRLYAEKIGCRFFHNRSATRLESLLNTIEATNLLFVDAPGLNPYAKDDRDILLSLSWTKNLLPVFVIPTWIDVQAGMDLIAAFHLPRCRHIVITGEDIDRRLGRVIALARSAGLRLGHISPRPHIAEGLEDLTPSTLAERCLRDIPRGFRAACAPSLQDKSSSPLLSAPLLQKPSPSLSPAAALAAPYEEDKRSAYTIAVASGKGGVGKTTLSIALAQSCAALDKKVLLFDADIGLANIDIQIGVKPQKDLILALRGTCQLSETITRVPEGGFDAIVGKSGTASFADLPPHMLETLYKKLRTIAQRYDLLLLDLGAGIDRTVRFLTTQADEMLLIVNEEPTALTDAYALIKVLLRRKAKARISVLVTMVESERHGERAFASLQRTCHNFLDYNLPLVGVVRRDSHIEDAIRARQPLLSRWPDSPAAQDITRLARTLVQRS